jgi:hypothetical protein
LPSCLFCSSACFTLCLQPLACSAVSSAASCARSSPAVIVASSTACASASPEAARARMCTGGGEGREVG